MLPNLDQYLLETDGYCYPDWNAIQHLIEQRVSPPDWNSAWRAAAMAWVERVQARLGGSYAISETDHFLLLSEAPKKIIRAAEKSFETALKKILSNLPGVASDDGYGPHVAFMFSSMDDYYAYISHFYPDGEHSMSGGICLDSDGYTHFAFPTTDYSSYQSILVHELAHACLAHLPLPTWVNEALAMRMEQAICNTDLFFLDREIYDRHIHFWNEITIQQFWTGEAWNIPGESNELSYSLAQVLWRKIEVDLGATQAEIIQFLLDATFEDAGEAALNKRLRLSLGELVSDFLGAGAWAPAPEKWPD